jgi:hypothetical protein
MKSNNFSLRHFGLGTYFRNEYGLREGINNDLLWRAAETFPVFPTLPPAPALDEPGSKWVWVRVEDNESERTRDAIGEISSLALYWGGSRFASESR